MKENYFMETSGNMFVEANKRKMKKKANNMFNTLYTIMLARSESRHGTRAIKRSSRLETKTSG